ncbi:MAG TPA: hypothetical protein VG498_15870 [Terriglobales bacterium]|nr:hypothetical protein [Terriglobales bacterium]
MRRRTKLALAEFLVCVACIAVSQGQSSSNRDLGQSASSAEVGESLSAVTVPAGTKVIMSLISPLHTVSATVESSLYLETLADVVVENDVAIPAHTHVQGWVTRVARPGRVIGRGQFQFEFTRLILPNNHVLPIAGRLQSVPGSAFYEKKPDGTIQPVDQIDKDAKALVTTAATGAAIGSISHGFGGAVTGGLIEVGFGLGTTLFKRGDDIYLPMKTEMEMILDQPVTIPRAQLTTKTNAAAALPPVDSRHSETQQK